MGKGIKIAATFAAVVAGLSIATSAMALPIISFDTVGGTAGGSVNYGGSGGVATGTDILFFNIEALDEPGGNSLGSLDCVSCTLDFTTGVNTSEGPSLWTFAGGGSFVLTGSAVDSLNNTIASGTLLSGFFHSSPGPSFGGNAVVLLFAGFGTDTKNPDLLNYFGLGETPFTFASTNISLGTVTIGPNGSFAGQVTNADIDNIAVPEPTTLGLLGTGLLALGFGLRRRMNG